MPDIDMNIINKKRVPLDCGSEEAHNMTPYTDEYIGQVVARLKSCGDNHIDASRILKEEAGRGSLEKHDYVRFRRGEYNIHEMLLDFGHDYARQLDIVTRLRLSSFPTLIETFDVGAHTYIVTRIEGTADSDLVLYYKYKGLEEQAYRDAVNDIRVLMENGYYMLPTFRYNIFVNNYGRIVLPGFSLISIEDADSQLVSDIFSRYGILCPWNNYRWEDG